MACIWVRLEKKLRTPGGEENTYHRKPGKLGECVDNDAQVTENMWIRCGSIINNSLLAYQDISILSRKDSQPPEKIYHNRSVIDNCDHYLNKERIPHDL